MRIDLSRNKFQRSYEYRFGLDSAGLLVVRSWLLKKIRGRITLNQRRRTRQPAAKTIVVIAVRDTQPY